MDNPSSTSSGVGSVHQPQERLRRLQASLSDVLNSIDSGGGAPASLSNLISLKMISIFP